MGLGHQKRLSSKSWIRYFFKNLTYLGLKITQNSLFFIKNNDFMKQTAYFFKTLALVAALIFCGDCARNPVTGKRQLSFMSTKRELAMGAEADPSIKAEMGEYADPKWQTYLNEKGQAMAKISHRPKLPFHFKVVDSPVVNAFAVPGGYVYFTRGILAHFNSEAQLMGVLGHEIGHVTARHGAESYTKGMLAKVGLIAGMILSPTFAQFGEAASQGLQLLMLKNSRANESQSDKLGVDYSSKTGYDAREMAGFFTTLQRLSDKSGGRIPNFLSTHPDPGERHKKVDLMARAFQQKKPAQYKIERESYLRRLEGMIYGDDPKQGYVENNVFYHPELKFQMPVPSGWQTMNAPTQFTAASKEGDAAVILTLSAEKTPQAAAKAFVEKNQLVATENQPTTINGMPAYAIVAEQSTTQTGQPTQSGQTQPSGNRQPSQPSKTPTDTRKAPKNVAANNAAATQSQGEAGPVRVAAYFILHNGLVYQVVGVSEIKNWNLRSIEFGQSLRGFNGLTDASKIDRKPEVVRIKTVNSAQTLSAALTGFGIASARLEEFSILNGMKLTDNLKPGTLIKIAEKN